MIGLNIIQTNFAYVNFQILSGTLDIYKIDFDTMENNSDKITDSIILQRPLNIIMESVRAANEEDINNDNRNPLNKRNTNSSNLIMTKNQAERDMPLQILTATNLSKTDSISIETLYL